MRWWLLSSVVDLFFAASFVFCLCVRVHCGGVRWKGKQQAVALSNISSASSASSASSSSSTSSSSSPIFEQEEKGPILRRLEKVEKPDSHDKCNSIHCPSIWGLRCVRDSSAKVEKQGCVCLHDDMDVLTTERITGYPSSCGYSAKHRNNRDRNSSKKPTSTTSTSNKRTKFLIKREKDSRKRGEQTHHENDENDPIVSGLEKDITTSKNTSTTDHSTTNRQPIHDYS